ncbi:MAG: flavoprotein, partial [Alphaproteobacteria bacterium]
MSENLPIAIIGAGPIGLAAASHLILRGEPVRVFEAAAQIAPNLRDWGHVRLFSVWEQCVDEAAVRLLKKNGWVSPPANKLPA